MDISCKQHLMYVYFALSIQLQLIDSFYFIYFAHFVDPSGPPTTHSFYTNETNLYKV